MTRTTGMLALLAGLGGFACGDNLTRPVLTKAEVMDPAACKDCHPQQYKDWSGSMHAYAAEDPVFAAMNRKGQDQTGGALGDFCVKCHAPVAVAEGLTTNGLNLATLPASVKGVTCYFCHSAASVDGSHNNPLKLATDGTLFGPFADPAPGTPHRSTYATLFDLASPDSAAACGSCHDIVNQHEVALERTYSEWQASLFSDLKVGQTCLRCHSKPTSGRASTMSTKVRNLLSHNFPGVDVALTTFPEIDAQRQDVQTLLDGALAGTVCLTDDLKVNVTLDNVGAGHSVPSGAGQDRRLWVELVAYTGGEVIYSSGVVPAGQTVEEIDDPDLWLIRDCLFNQDQTPTHDFWDAASVSLPNLIDAPVLPKLQDPKTLTRSHVKNVFPRSGPLPAKPDRITLKVLLKPIGDDVLKDLVASGYLGKDIADAVPRFTLGGLLDPIAEWTSEAARMAYTDVGTNMKVFGCVSTSNRFSSLADTAVSHRRCEP